MSIFKKRGTAIAITAALVVLAVLFGVNRSIKKEAEKVESLFYSGVYSEAKGYTLPSIDSQLTSRLNASTHLVNLARQHDELSAEAKALSEARTQLINAETISEKFAANEALESAYLALVEKLEGYISEADLSNLNDDVSALSNAQRVINESNYNDKVSEFETEVMGAFPMSILKIFVTADLPERFGGIR